MISYFLLPAVILCVAASQLANITDELNKVWKNQTFGVFTNGNITMTPNNEVKPLQKGPLRETENELENTISVIPEDDESFQDQNNKHLHYNCNQSLQIQLSHFYCGEMFHVEMSSIRTDDHCVLKSIIRPYNDLTECLEKVSEISGCFFPNSDVQEFFLYIHSSYFQNCKEKSEEQFEDAPTSLVVALTIIPVSLIPVLVCLVLWKSKRPTAL